MKTRLHSRRTRIEWVGFSKETTPTQQGEADRKSTRPDPRHNQNLYAVVLLKKKRADTRTTPERGIPKSRPHCTYKHEAD